MTERAVCLKTARSMLEEGSSGSSVEGLLRGRVEESEVRSILGESCTDEDSFLEDAEKDVFL